MSDGDMTYSSDQIEQLLQCAVCLDRYKTPKLLPCQHTFCHQPCLEGLVDHRTRMVRCPECRADHIVPRGGTANFPNNLTIISFLELPGQRRSTGFQFEEAQATGSNVTAAVVPQAAGAVGDGIAGAVGGAPAVAGVATCSDCLRERNLSRCAHCNDLLCDACKRAHIGQLKLEVGRMIGQIRRGLPNMSESLNNISNTGTQLQQRMETAKEELTEAIERHIRELRDRHRQLLNEIDSFILGELRSLRGYQENVEVEVASIDSFCDSSEASLNRSTTPEAHIIEMRHQCLENLQTVREHGSTRIRPPVMRQLQIEMEGQYLSNTISHFGEVIITSGLSRNVPSPQLQHDEAVEEPSIEGREVRDGRDVRERREGRATWQTPSSMDYSLRVQDSRSPSVSPNLERRGPYAREPRQPRVVFEEEDDGIDDGEIRMMGNRSLPSSPHVGVRRRPRREHHSDTRLAGLMGGGGGMSFLERSRARHRSIGALPLPEDDSSEQNSVSSESPPRFLREQTYVRESPARNATNTTPSDSTYTRPVRQAVRFDVAMNSSSDSQADEPLPLTHNRMNSSPSMYVSSARNKYNQKGHAILRFGERGNEHGKFTWPRGVTVSRLDDNIFVADSSNHRVQVFDSDGRFIKTFGTYGQNEGEFDCLAGIAVNGLNQVIISDRYNHRIQVFDRHGHFQRSFGSEGTRDGQLNYPWGVACDNMGFIYVCDKENHRIQVFQSNGSYVRKMGRLGHGPGQLENPHYVAVSSDNRVYVSDSSNHRIQVFSIYGDFLFTFGVNGTQRGQLKFPRGIAIDNQGFVVVADSGNNRIQIFRADGRFYSMFGSWGNENGQFKGLEGIAIMSGGNVVVSDRENHRIQVF